MNMSINFIVYFWSYVENKLSYFVIFFLLIIDVISEVLKFFVFLEIFFLRCKTFTKVIILWNDYSDLLNGFSENMILI